MDAAVVALHEAAERRLWLPFVATVLGARHGPTQWRMEGAMEVNCFGDPAVSIVDHGAASDSCPSGDDVALV